MLIAVLSLIALILGIGTLVGSTFVKIGPLSNIVGTGKQRVVAILLLVIGVTGFVSRSFVTIGPDSIGTLTRVYFDSNMAPGQVVALDGQKGPLAKILPPGFHFIPFINVLYDVQEQPIVEVPEGGYGLLVAKDGRPLRDSQFIADPWPEAKFTDMLNGEYFLTDGQGQKGPQLTVLRPGRYRINPFLFSVQMHRALDVPTGHVAVIRSNVETTTDCPDVNEQLNQSNTGTGIALSAPLVPNGCIGVWDKPKQPGRYYLNNRAYVSTIIPTRVQTWTYKGGYTARKINLVVGDNGKISQREEQVNVPEPENAASHAINVRVEGWTIPVDMRVTIQVHPEDAPRVVASVGDLQRVQDNIVTPAIRDILRTIGGHPDRKVLDFIQKRGELVALIETALAPEGLKAGVTIQEVRMGEPAIPPELLVATLREQLATQLRQTYIEEQAAQKERIEVERERATADQQSVLVKAEIQKAAAEYQKERLRLEGEGEKLKLIEIAQGQKAQVQVLGEDRVLELQMLKEALAAAIEQPDIVKIPQVYVSGSGTSLEGAAAILGASNLVRAIKPSAQK
jgi:regulator of protease activity HflC (stomatin/prohibitin superfamily)